MKYSRDHADIHMYDNYFMSTLIPQMVHEIADTGVTHITVNTPYDSEFYPMLTTWVTAIRKENLSIYFRMNWKRWEGWFGAQNNMTRDEHIQLTKSFILSHPDLFQNSDIFSPCSECENGGPGDPRTTGDTEGHAQFLINEYNTVKSTFSQIGKDVSVNNFPMNKDIADIVMNKSTTKQLGGMITVDDYTKDPVTLAYDMTRLSQQGDGDIFVGEIGIPLDYLHGYMTEKEQNAWIETALSLLSTNNRVKGVNYWVNRGGTTALWNHDGSPRKIQNTLKKYYNPYIAYGRITDQNGDPVPDAQLTYNNYIANSDDNGCYTLLYPRQENNTNSYIPITIIHEKYQTLKDGIPEEARMEKNFSIKNK
jgi:hypothetical protein